MLHSVKMYINKVCKIFLAIFKNEFPPEEGDISHFVSNEIQLLKYKRWPLKSCFSATSL